MTSAAATRAARPSSRIARVVAAVFLGWAAVYLWPLLDGSDEASFDAVDVSLRLAATLAASGAALLGALRSAGAQRWAFGSLAVGANVWAVMQAVRWGYELGRPGSGPGWLGVAGSAAFGVAAVAAVMQLLLAGGPSARTRGPLDVALITGPVVLAAWSAGFGEIVGRTDGAATVASPVGRLLLDGVLVTLTCVLLARPPLVRGLPVLGTGLLALAFGDGVAVAFAVRFQEAPERLVGLLTCAGLTLVALAVLTATSGDDEEATVAPLRPSVLPTALPRWPGSWCC